MHTTRGDATAREALVIAIPMSEIQTSELLKQAAILPLPETAEEWKL
jgi:hypothetical protein